MEHLQISKESFLLLKQLCQSEYFEKFKDNVIFEDKTNTVITDEIQELMHQINMEVFFEGLTDDKEEVTPYGEKLERLYDELLDA